MTNLLDVSDLASYMPDLDTSSFSATTLSGVISRSQQRMANYCNVKGFELATETAEVDRTLIKNTGELIIWPRRKPLVSLTSVDLVRGGFDSTMTLSDQSGNALYHIPSPGDRVHIPNAYLVLTGTLLAGGSSQLLTLKGANTFTKITYTGGWRTVPDDLKLALALTVRDTINVRVRGKGIQSFSQGSYSESYGQATQPSALNVEVRDILDQGGYKRMEIY